MKRIVGETLRNILDSYFDIVTERCTNEEVVIRCPETACGDQSGNRSFNLKTGVTSCWRCGNPTSPQSYVWLESHGVDLSDVESAEVGQVSLIQSLKDRLGVQAVESKVLNDKLYLPRGSKPLKGNEEHRIVKAIAAMAVRKNLDLESFKVGQCHFTSDIFEAPAQDWRRCCIFPAYEYGRLVYYQGRTYSMQDEGGSTKLFPSKHTVPAGSKYWVYNWDEAAKPNVEVIIVVESILNVMSLKNALAKIGADWAEPVAIFKHHLSTIQVNKLLLLGASEICLMFDGDAVKSMWTEARKLLGVKKVSIAEMPVGIDANDDVNLALQRFESREQWSPIKAMMSGLK